MISIRCLLSWLTALERRSTAQSMVRVAIRCFNDVRQVIVTGTPTVEFERRLRVRRVIEKLGAGDRFSHTVAFLPPSEQPGRELVPQGKSAVLLQIVLGATARVPARLTLTCSGATILSASLSGCSRLNMPAKTGDQMLNTEWACLGC